MKLRLPDPEIIRAEPRLANLSENAVYHLLMRRKSSSLPGPFLLTYLATLAITILLSFGVIYLLPSQLRQFSGWLGGMVSTHFMIVVFRLQRAGRMHLAEEFLGYAKESADHYALLPITPEEIVFANWGNATLLPLRVFAIGAIGVGLILLIIAHAQDSFFLLLAVIPSFFMSGFWLGVGPYNTARSLIQTARKSSQVKHAVSLTIEDRYTRPRYRYEYWILGGVFLAFILSILTVIFMHVVGFRDWFSSLLTSGFNISALGLGYLLGMRGGIAAQNQMESAICNAIDDVAHIQQAAFDRLSDSKPAKQITASTKGIGRD